jgi:nitrite reductase (NADH) small subunit
MRRTIRKDALSLRPMTAATRAMRAVTLSVGDLSAARRLYEEQLGMRVVAEATVSPADDALRALWGLPPATGGRLVWLEQPGATSGAIRLVEFEPRSPIVVTDGARAYDHGLIKNLDFFTDDVDGAYARMTAAGFPFPAPPVRYPVPWGRGVFAYEAHSAGFEGVKLSVARLIGAPRKAFGEAGHETPFTEVAVAAQVVKDFHAAERFYCDVFDCVPAADTVVENEALIAALRLPPGTRLRMSFIGPASAVGGKIGLIAYEGEGVADARSLASRAQPPHRGAVMMTFECADARSRHARALACGAAEVAAPSMLDLAPFGSVLASSFRSPDGLLIELIQAGGVPEDIEIDVLDAALLPDGAHRGIVVPGLGRIVLANVNGHPVALEDRCPHLRGPLSLGAFDGCRITCPWHGWMIDAPTGAVSGGHGLRVRSFPARVDNGRILVRHPRP